MGLSLKAIQPGVYEYKLGTNPVQTITVTEQNKSNLASARDSLSSSQRDLGTPYYLKFLRK